MATWDEMVGYLNIQGLYNIGNVTDSLVILQFREAGEGDIPANKIRLTRCTDFQDDNWVHIDAVRGRYDHVELRKLIAASSMEYCAAISGDDQFVLLRHSLPLRGLSPELLDIVIGQIAVSANILQDEFAAQLEKGFSF